MSIDIGSSQSSMAIAAAAAVTSSSSTLFPTTLTAFQHNRLSSIVSTHPVIKCIPRRPPSPSPLKVSASLSSSPSPIIQTTPDDLVSCILSKVIQTDRGVRLNRDEHKAVAEIATQLQQFCVDAPVNSPLIFGEWDVVYCSNPTSPGGGYRSAIGRLIFNTNEMIQDVQAPDIIRNKVSFSAFGFLDGEVSLKGKLIALDERWIQVIFEAPQLKVGGLDFQYGGQSEVKLQITYIDEKIRLGVGSRGSLFVFLRRK